MGRAFARGLLGACRRWPIVIVLWLAGVAFALAFTLTASNWLDRALDESFASRSLVWDLNFNLLGDLLAHHRESLTVLWVVPVMLVVFFLLFSVWLTAGAVAGVQDPDVAFTLAEFWAGGIRRYRVFLRLWLAVTGLEITTLAAVAAVVRGANRWWVESPNELSRYFVLGTGVTVAAAMLLVLVVTHDHARIYAVRKQAGAWQALRWASWFVVRGDRRALPLAAVLLLAGGVLWLVYQPIAGLIPVTSANLVTVSLLWGQVLMLGRALLRVASFAAQTDLQSEMPE
jgi:hypothetical protein